MESRTRVGNMEMKRRVIRPEKPDGEMTKPIELSQTENRWMIRFWQADRLVRNLAVVGALLLAVIAVKNSTVPEAQSVFSALQESAGMEWDESVGKLSFVNSLFPEAIQQVWNPSPAVTVYAPVRGDTVHTWSEGEPYITIQSKGRDVRAAADGEVMSIAHGLGEERIIRIRHEDDTEALYGNLESAWVEEGQAVCAGDVIASLIDGVPLAFELRVDGRSVNPEGRLIPFEE